jgi:hypothetical protein
LSADTTFPLDQAAGISDGVVGCARRADFKDFAPRRNTLYHKGFLLFATLLVLSVAFYKNRGVENDRDTPESGRQGRHFLRPLGGCNAPKAAVVAPELRSLAEAKSPSASMAKIHSDGLPGSF